LFSSPEVDVPRTTGPTIARWQLARELRTLREGTGHTHAQVAEVLGCSEWKIYKIGSGDVGVGRADLLVMLDKYGVTDERVRETLLDPQKQGKERGWWSKFGQLPAPYSMYIGLESVATEVKNFELAAAIPGLLQTEEYARALLTAQHSIWFPAEHSHVLCSGAGQLRDARTPRRTTSAVIGRWLPIAWMFCRVQVTYTFVRRSVA
jgi:hypothetical protein